MTLTNLYDMIGSQLKLNPRKGDDVVCIKVFGSDFGGQTVENIKDVGCGIDWDDGKFVIYPEKELLVKKD